MQFALPVPLDPQSASNLRLPWTSLLSREDLVQHVAKYPGMSWYVPGTNAYLIAGPWRNRDDIVEILESRGDRYRPALWTSLMESIINTAGAIIVDPTEYKSAAHFYHTVKVSCLETVLVLRNTHIPGPELSVELEIQSVLKRGIAELIAIDWDSFPWLWRNSRREFEEYLDSPGVHAWVAYKSEEPIGYVSLTLYDDWGHIDRLAVRPNFQGRGYGAQLLSWALRQLHVMGAKYAQLSTQETNERSFKLYSSFGFKLCRGGYKIYGKYLG